ncbi:hypothetical protein A5886_002974 [Enterococcus sp. 8G7_MSG3316]|uniref:DUF1861 family protein n=1 Tax=Candidatus Enterococcus testudinis TaxID=1834191 RepID=A0A242AB91_9ENTE|nr:DUF1861 family protein [Enterococcus sp. 8G7_MSG3316]OTN77873.1 hypothetical protein A5886_002974 [Enterococcus sp. 8G7_MSG3316]
MNVTQQKKIFELQHITNTGEILEFDGVPGFDVYNCSQPFIFNEEWYMYGRVEKRSEWMNSHVRLFKKRSELQWSLVNNAMIYQLEDPYITKIKNHIVLGGTHVQVKQENFLGAYYGYFYYGQELDNLKYFTTGPRNMKDIRIVELKDGRIGIFSRPRDTALIKKYGSESLIGFIVVDSLEELTAETIYQAPILPNLFENGEWGGVNQAYLLDSGKIGVIGHRAYKNGDQKVYTVISFVLDPITRQIDNYKIIATRKSFPKGPAKRSHLQDCCFPSGITIEKGKCILYSGLGDCNEGIVEIPYPFKNDGSIC